MAESLERCFSRAMLKHFPSEDGDTDEEFQLSKEDRDRERKDKKKSKNSRQSGPDSLIRATEQVQKRKATSGGKGGNQPHENGSKFAHGPPGFQYSNGPTHPHMNTGLPRPGNDPLHGMYHPSQQARLHFLYDLMQELYNKNTFFRTLSMVQFPSVGFFRQVRTLEMLLGAG